MYDHWSIPNNWNSIAINQLWRFFFINFYYINIYTAKTGFRQTNGFEVANKIHEAGDNILQTRCLLSPPGVNYRYYIKYSILQIVYIFAAS